LAPVQCVTWGHPDTTGIPNLDYFVSCDAMEPDGAAAHYSETLMRLSGPTVHVQRPALAARKPRAAFGLPDEAHVYVCPQSLFKLHPDFDGVVASILAGDPQGLVVLLEGKDRHHKEILLERMQRDGGVDISRVRILPQQPPQDFVNLIAVSDVMLDPLHYSGGKTSLEAFAMGTPIVTWPGEFMRGRHTYGWYKLMGIDRLIARDWDDYVRLALALGTDPQARAAASAEITEKRDVLYENKATIRAIETFFAAAVEAAGRGTRLRSA
jgi:predicted O-linked N-acetylglucosamine transferase (SPINDLY family)